MAYFAQKQKNGIFIKSYGNGDISFEGVTLKADTNTPYESGTILVDIVAVGADQGKFTRASDLAVADVEAATRAVILRDRTFAEVDTNVLVLESVAEVTEKLTDLADLAAASQTAVKALFNTQLVKLR